MDTRASRPRTFLSALPFCFVEADGCGCGDIERVGSACHRDPHVLVCMAKPKVAQAIAFAAKQQCGGLFVVNVPVQVLGLGSGGDGLNLMFREPF